LLKVQMEQFEKKKQDLIDRKELFEDPDFPANSGILDSDHAKNPNVVWRRPEEILKQYSLVPKFIVGSRVRFDVDQHVLGDCWFLAALATLATRPALLETVAPSNQSFEPGKYAGIFRFNFWRYGKWEQVIIDDRLPTLDGYLIYCYNHDEENEFWSALCEKAYAKFYGSYQAIHGGWPQEALVDMTGAVTEEMELNEDLVSPDRLWKRMLTCNNPDYGALLNAVIYYPLKPKIFGLPYLHCYSITAAKEVSLKGPDFQINTTLPPYYRLARRNEVVENTEGIKNAIAQWARIELEDGEIQGPGLPWAIVQEKSDGYKHKLIIKDTEKVRLVRVRNPHGNYKEFQGIWSEGSSIWNSLSEETRQSLDLRVADDGEFWMTLDEFIKYFDFLSLTHLTRVTFEPIMFDQNRRFFLDRDKFEWGEKTFKGSWPTSDQPEGQTPSSYVVELSRPLDFGPDDKVPLIVSLTQMNRRRLHHNKRLQIGFHIGKPKTSVGENKFYKLEEGEVDVVSSAWPTGRADLREFAKTFFLMPGTYIVMPDEAEQTADGEFLFRVMTLGATTCYKNQEDKSSEE